MVIDSVLGYRPNTYMRWHGGIYAIVNLVSGRAYIGQTHCFFDRRSAHESALRYNKHQNKAMQADWNTHSSKNFKFDMLFAVRYPMLSDKAISREELSNLELEYWKQYQPNCYNIVMPRMYSDWV